MTPARWSSVPQGVWRPPPSPCVSRPVPATVQARDQIRYVRARTTRREAREQPGILTAPPWHWWQLAHPGPGVVDLLDLYTWRIIASTTVVMLFTWSECRGRRRPASFSRLCECAGGALLGHSLSVFASLVSGVPGEARAEHPCCCGRHGCNPFPCHFPSITAYGHWPSEIRTADGPGSAVIRRSTAKQLGDILRELLVNHDVVDLLNRSNVLACMRRAASKAALLST
ncbi:MAG: hypothetical protein JWQ95_439 [Sphaerisporangium sp.]|nr:hypothetical protein [Sphaerisporangium sp.]